MPKKLFLAAALALLGASLICVGCSSEPSNAELMSKIKDQPSNNPDVPVPTVNEREMVMGGMKGGGATGKGAGK